MAAFEICTQGRMRTVASDSRLVIPGHDPAVFECFTCKAAHRSYRVTAYVPRCAARGGTRRIAAVCVTGRGTELACCGPMNRTLVFTLAATTFLGAACGSSSPSSPTPISPGADMTINITGINGAQSFAPSPTTVNVGQRVIWKNTDTRSHDASADNGNFTTPVLASGASSDPIAMNTRGTFTYKCTIHPSMVGTITVQ